jgi:glycosyltransferase involved in cell wall biosynthesis
MKIIIASPVKNEEWILPSTLKNFSSFADHIILADQKSTDKTREICARFEKVTVIDNPFKGYTNEIRWMLLDEARKIPGNNVIICLDADEQISPDFINEIKEHLKTRTGTGAVGFYTKWLQIYGSDTTYRTDEPWKKNYKTFAFYDDREIDYSRDYVTQEHIDRIPATPYIVELDTPILHMQWLGQKRSEIKQAVYMCTEKTEGWDPRKTNNRYSVAKFIKNAPLEKIKEPWLKEIYFPTKEERESYDPVKLQDIMKMFDAHGSLYFEPLEIWNVHELKERFVRENNREPTRIEVYPKWLTYLNAKKNTIKNNARVWYTKKNK